MIQKLSYHNTAPLLHQHAHGYHDKDMAVLHETISPDAPGWSDIDSVESYLAGKDYGIHGMTDLEGHIAWSLGLGRAVFWQCGGVNERSIGIEQVSNIPLRSKYNAERRRLWALRDPQLRATARLLAAWHNSNPKAHPLKFSNGLGPGVTSHWNVSQHFWASQGHSDCHPVHLGGYYPILTVIRLAKAYAATGLHF